MLSKNFDLQAVSLNEIAKRSRMAKSNVYRYFESREDLVLSLLWEEWVGWRNDLEAWLDAGPERSRSIQDYSSWVAASIAERELLCALTSALPSVVERNLSESRIREFKSGSLIFFREAGGRVASVFSVPDAETHSRILYDLACLISGIYPHARPSKIVSRVLSSADLGWFRRDLRVDVERYLNLLLMEKQWVR